MKWFRHNSDSNRDPKLEKILMKYGAEGYALYWMILELIAAPLDSKNLNFELQHDAEILGYRLKIDSARVEEIMLYMISVELFESNTTTNKITCIKLVKLIENAIVKSPQLRLMQKSLQELESGIIPDNPGYPRTELELELELEPDNINIISNKFNKGQNIEITKKGRKLKGQKLIWFYQFWETFDYKKGKSETMDVWLDIPNLTEQLVQEICNAAVMVAILRLQQLAAGQTPKMPQGWLSGKRWEDEADHSAE